MGHHNFYDSLSNTIHNLIQTNTDIIVPQEIIRTYIISEITDGVQYYCADHEIPVDYSILTDEWFYNYLIEKKVLSRIDVDKLQNWSKNYGPYLVRNRREYLVKKIKKNHENLITITRDVLDKLKDLNLLDDLINLDIDVTMYHTRKIDSPYYMAITYKNIELTKLYISYGFKFHQPEKLFNSDMTQFIDNLFKPPKTISEIARENGWKIIKKKK
jgi:hypothetical protein